METPQLGPGLLSVGQRAGHDLIKRWRTRMALLHMVRSGVAVDSVEARAEVAGRGLSVSVSTIDRAKFTDWGVGRGRPLRDPSSGKYTVRKGRKRFYTPHLGDDASAIIRRVRSLLASRADALLERIEAAQQPQGPQAL